MKHILLTVAVLLVVVSPSFADDMQERLRVARAYEKTTPVVKMLDETLAQIRKSPMIAHKPEIFDLMVQSLDKEKIKEQTIELMAKHFTTAELEALTTFYNTEEGKAIMKKMPLYIAESQPIIQKEVMQSMASAMKQIQEKESKEK